MAEGRLLNRKISKNKKVADLTNDTSRLVYTWTIAHLDVEGRVAGDPDVLKGMVVPRLPHITPKSIEEFIREWAEAGFVIWYEAEDDLWLQFIKFDRNQPNLRKDRETPSSIPSVGVATRILAIAEELRALEQPDEDTGAGTDGATPEDCRSSAGVTPEQHGNNDGAAPEDVRPKIKRREVEENMTSSPADAEDPVIPVDKVADRYKPAAAILATEYGLSLRASHINLLDDLFRNNYPSTVYQQLNKVKKKAVEEGRAPPSEPIHYIHSYMKDWTIKTKKAEQGPSRPPREVKCAACGALLVGTMAACGRCGLDEAEFGNEIAVRQHRELYESRAKEG